jgi:hypothetical protein
MEDENITPGTTGGPANTKSTTYSTLWRSKALEAARADLSGTKRPQPSKDEAVDELKKTFKCPKPEKGKGVVQLTRKGKGKARQCSSSVSPIEEGGTLSDIVSKKKSVRFK